jgi:hypothetical protein
VARSPEQRSLSALPSARARALAFLAIVVAGAAGALIGWSFVELQCHGACTGPAGIGAVVGGGAAAGGVAVVAVLTLRAMGEWRTIRAQQELERALAEGEPGAGGGTDPEG